jgi:hypothetical protein
MVSPRNHGFDHGTQLGSHEITALLRKGGMGEVYRARDLELKRMDGHCFPKPRVIAYSWSRIDLNGTLAWT